MTAFNQPHLQHPTKRLYDNFAHFFVFQDGIVNAAKDVSYSIMPFYKCDAGCAVCYMKNAWSSEYPPQLMSPNFESRALDLFSCFDVINVRDDLLLLSKQYPAYYDFYKKHSGSLYLSSMTDVAFLQQHPIIMNDMSFLGIYDLTFSDSFLALHPKTIGVVLGKLNEVIHKMPIAHIKFIVTSDDLSPQIRQIIEWCSNNSVSWAFHDDTTQTRNLRWSEDGSTHFTSISHAEDNERFSNLYLIVNEGTQVQHLSFFTTLVETTNKYNDPSYHTVVDQFDSKRFLSDLVVGKKQLYAQYANNPPKYNTQYLQYYKWVVDHVVANPQYNFIPWVFVNQLSSKFKDSLTNQHHFVEHELGLVVRGATNIIPLVAIL